MIKITTDIIKSGSTIL